VNELADEGNRLFMKIVCDYIESRARVLKKTGGYRLLVEKLCNRTSDIEASALTLG